MKRVAGTLWLMGAAAVLLFLVACVNVATLTLVRFDARERELAVRAALGAGRARVASYHFAESVVLAAAGASTRRQSAPRRDHHRLAGGGVRRGNDRARRS